MDNKHPKVENQQGLSKADRWIRYCGTTGGAMLLGGAIGASGGPIGAFIGVVVGGAIGGGMAYLESKLATKQEASKN